VGYEWFVKLIFMGTPEFSVPSLKRLLLDGHDIVAVFTQPDKPAGRGKHLHTPPVKSFALEHHKSVHQPSKIKNNDDVRTIFETVSPDACVVVAYGKILPQWLLQIPRLGCINVHASLLPKYRGAAPINWAIANGEQETGVTIMQMDEGMDTGPMLATRTVAIGIQETAPELSSRLSELGAELLSETLPLVATGGLRPMPQDDRCATYAPLLKREHGLINWTMSAKEIANRVRAFQPWPGMFTNFRGGPFDDLASPCNSGYKFAIRSPQGSRNNSGDRCGRDYVANREWGAAHRRCPNGRQASCISSGIRKRR
jgi:methionyl-tRNA formyltransferase